jgi:nitroreductase/dihydropteridine reductase
MIQAFSIFNYEFKIEMMSFINAIKNRYTTKVFDASKKIEKNKIEELKEILRLSPSSINSQPWEFVFVSDKKLKGELASVSQHNTDKVLNCDTVIVFRRVENLSGFKVELEQRLPEYAMDFYKSNAKNNSEKDLKTWFEKQLYISLGVLLSACAQMQIDATPMEGIEPLQYDEIVGNENFKTVLAVAIGYRNENDFNQLKIKPKSRKLLEDVVRTL